MAVAACNDDLAPSVATSVANNSDDYFILSTGGSTRVVTDDNASRFEDGDLLGGFALDGNGEIEVGTVANVCYMVVSKENIATDVVDRQILEAVNPKDALPKGAPKYLFYYPYDKNVTSVEQIKEYTHTVAVDQTTAEAYEASDLLWDVAIPDQQHNCVNIYMDHAMSSIIVHLDPDLSTEKDIRILLSKNTAKSIDLASPSLDDLIYSVEGEDNAEGMKMYYMGVDGNFYNKFRLLIPAQTIAKGTPLIKVGEKTYTLQEAVEMKPGYNYHFVLRKSTQVVIPETTDDDSWVLDVFNSKGDHVGLLCREYIHYQPDRAWNAVDIPTTPSSDANPNSYISSQAWVFYNLQDGSNYPDLTNGVVMRFIYDILADPSRTSGLDSKYISRSVTGRWPLPHHYQHAGGVFLADHGHNWVVYGDDASNDAYGGSSADWVENYMHGGKIIWGTRADDGVSYSYIASFTMPEKQITNEQALEYGHIAIPVDGKPFVSYSEYSEGDAKDADGNEIAWTSPHYLIDTHDGRTYPIVKMGFNNFWMSKSYAATTMSDGTQLLCYNNVPEEGKYNYVTFDGNDELQAGYLYPRSGDYDPFAESDDLSKFPKLYSYYAQRDTRFVPPSQDSRMTVEFPITDDYDQTLHYFGWCFTAKIMTDQIATRTGNDMESAKDALAADKIWDSQYTSYTCNVSGFNLRANGQFFFFENSFSGFGSVCTIWLGDDITVDPTNITYLKFNSYDCFSRSSFNQIVEKQYYTTNGWSDEAHMSRQFCEVRFLMHFKNQKSLGSASTDVTVTTPSPTTRALTSSSRDIYLPM